MHSAMCKSMWNVQPVTATHERLTKQIYGHQIQTTPHTLLPAFSLLRLHRVCCGPKRNATRLWYCCHVAQFTRCVFGENGHNIQAGILLALTTLSSITFIWYRIMVKLLSPNKKKSDMPLTFRLFRHLNMPGDDNSDKEAAEDTNE